MGADGLRFGVADADQRIWIREVGVIIDEHDRLLVEIINLYDEYRQLTEELANLQHQFPPNQIQIKKLKFKILRKKDRILRLENDIIPDIDA